MARRASVRHYRSRNGYYTHYRGEQVKLAAGPRGEPNGPTFLAALDKFRELMLVSHVSMAGQANTVRVILDLYGQHLEKNGQRRSLQILLDTCTSAAEAFGDRTVGELIPDPPQVPWSRS